MKHTMGEEANHSFMLRRPEDLQLLFERFYNSLCNYAFSIIRHDQDAEDVVQSLFLELWEKRASAQIPAEPQFFLLRATKNRAIDHLRRQTRIAQSASAAAEILEHRRDHADGRAVAVDRGDVAGVRSHPGRGRRRGGAAGCRVDQGGGAVQGGGIEHRRPAA